MRLVKWYGDALVGGRYVIHYAAHLRLGPLSLGYRGYLDSAGNRSVEYSPGPIELPRQDSDLVDWPTNKGSSISWIGQGHKPIILHQDTGRQLRWTPCVFNGACRLETGAQSGRGYVEKIELEFAPWKLGLTDLKWGRFCGETHSLIWIFWEGRISKKAVILDGRLYEGPCTFEQGSLLLGDDYLLEFTDATTLVDEQLLDGALKKIPLPRRIEPLNFLTGREHKLCAKGQLYRGGKSIDHGHIIYETVTWSDMK